MRFCVGGWFSILVSVAGMATKNGELYCPFSVMVCAVRMPRSACLLQAC